MSRFAGIALALLLLAAAPSLVLAHKGKLPADARTLVQQAAAMLAKGAEMKGEVKERLDAALIAQDRKGVDMTLVAEARRVFQSGDFPAARALLLKALVSPVGQPVPPSPQARPPVSAAPQPPVPAPGTSGGPPPLPSAPAGPPPASAAPVPPAGTEELRAAFGGTPAEYVVAGAGVVLALLGVVLLRRGG